MIITIIEFVRNATNNITTTANTDIAIEDNHKPNGKNEILQEHFPSAKEIGGMLEDTMVNMVMVMVIIMLMQQVCLPVAPAKEPVASLHLILDL